MLGNVRKLNLSFTKISDVSMLGNCEELDLSFCYNISMLGNVKKLNLLCTNI